MLPYHLYTSLHLIGLIAWMAGLLYLVRLLIYHSETLEKNQAGKEYLIQQFILMAKRLHNIITLPAAIITVLAGTKLMLLTQAYLQGWFHFKLMSVILLFLYHAYTYRLVVKFRNINAPNMLPHSSRFLRFYNELATLLMITIIFTVITKSIAQTLSVLLILVGVIVLTMIAMIFIKKLKK